MMPMYRGEDGAATCARAAAAAASFAWADALAVLVATFLRTFDLGTLYLLRPTTPVTASPGLYATVSSLRCAAPDAARSTAAPGHPLGAGARGRHGAARADGERRTNRESDLPE